MANLPGPSRTRRRSKSSLGRTSASFAAPVPSPLIRTPVGRHGPQPSSSFRKSADPPCPAPQHERPCSPELIGAVDLVESKPRRILSRSETGTRLVLQRWIGTPDLPSSLVGGRFYKPEAQAKGVRI